MRRLECTFAYMPCSHVCDVNFSCQAIGYKYEIKHNGSCGKYRTAWKEVRVIRSYKQGVTVLPRSNSHFV